VNVDRNPAAIAQTLVHERQHHRPPGRSESCAQWRAVFFYRSMAEENQQLARSGRFPAYTTSRLPFSSGTCGFSR
jgi:hypothetical protein